jgi:trans-aconitate 2-methyltransferase
MADWDPELYLRFEDQRTRPCRELVARVSLPAGEVRQALDLGCGPGNSTAALMACYPAAHVTGVDNSPEMLAKARADFPEWAFEQGDLATWQPAAEIRGKVDVILANASLQWVPNHAALFPRLMGWLRQGGELAVQIPQSEELPVLKLIVEVARSAAFAKAFEGFVPPYLVHAPEAYYDVLAPHCRQVDLTEVIYYHLMDGPEGVVEWIKGTGLRPWFDRAGARSGEFLAEYARRIVAAYPRRADGKVLMAFRRLNILACR